MDNQNRAWFLYGVGMLAFMLVLLGGAEMAIIDLRNNGYNVPHIWQRVNPAGPCEARQ